MTKRAILALIALFGVMLFVRAVHRLSVPALSETLDLEPQFQRIFALRTECLRSGNAAALRDLYAVEKYSGECALDHESARVRYFSEWLSKRNIRITAVDATLSIVDVGSNGDSAWGSVCHNLIIDYSHQGGGTGRFGIRTVHWIELTLKDGRWRISKDWFWDPFGDGLFPRVPAANIAPGTGETSRVRSGGSYNREAAVRYADRYCGVRVGGSDGRYNQDYRDFTGLGGDCANFASQVLTDKAAGGLERDGAWFYRNGKGTNAWLCAADFVYHLIGSGRGVVVKRGKYQAVAGLVGTLMPGDIIAYDRKGTIEHVSVVTGGDGAGHVYVNSHSADRYHVPWDLGVTERDVVWLIHIVA